MRKKLSYLIIIALIFTSGCWDLRDVNNTAFVLAIGVDAPSDPDTAKYKVTFEFAKPVLQGQNSQVQSTVASIDADGILHAIQGVQTSISRSISLSHLRLVAVGEDIAKTENFKDFANYLIHEPDSALQLRLIFVQNAHARDLFYTNQRFENRLAAEIVAMGLMHHETSPVRTNNFLEFITDLNRSNGNALGSRTSIQQGENIIVRDGAAVFKDWKLVAWLNADEAQGANWLVERTEGVVVAHDEDNTYTYQVIKQKTKIKPLLNEGNPSMNVHVITEGMVLEETGKDVDLSKPENLKKMEELFSQAIKQQVEPAINKSQNEIKADYLELGKVFQKYESKAFKSLNWDEIYPTIPINVQVTCKVKSYGLRK